MSDPSQGEIDAGGLSEVTRRYAQELLRLETKWVDEHGNPLFPDGAMLDDIDTRERDNFLFEAECAVLFILEAIREVRVRARKVFDATGEKESAA